MKPKKIKNRLFRGRDWHGWAFWHPDWVTRFSDGLSLFAEPKKPKTNPMATGGFWVRVKFVPIKKEKRSAKG